MDVIFLLGAWRRIPRFVYKQYQSNISNLKFTTEWLKAMLREDVIENDSRVKPLSANPTKWSNILKKFVGKLFECV